MRRLGALLAVLLLLLSPAWAQEQQENPENIQIGLSTDHITITADFSGADLTIFGSLENADPLIARQNRYDVVVVLEGPSRPVVVRRKDRVLGMWINTQSENFVNVPASYSVATTRQYQDITDPASYRRLSLGAASIYLEPSNRDEPLRVSEFTTALRALMLKTGLYSERLGDVQFLSQNLFRATLTLPPNVPVGTHKARAFLFKNGLFIKETSAQLSIRKSGFEQTLFRLADNHGIFFGFCAVLLAVATGWLGRIIFRRD
ncbi:MAG: TIGR02186 family protein [Methylobacterium mesophilicum]|nr:TIGR02186 family protein [Methylobacterium mesophilicum]